MSEELKKRILSSIILVPSIILIIFVGSIIFNLFLLISFSIIVYEWNKICKTKKNFYIGIFFLIFSFYSIYNLYNFNNDNLNFIFVLTICISTDIGGYVFGKILKGPKLFSISPNKTYAGAIGGYLFSIISVYILFKQSTLIFEIQNTLFFSNVMVIIISTVSQLGDICISYFKRLSKIKDTGNIIPGHGGLLDRVDGMIFAFPFSYITLIVNSKFF